MRGVIVLFFFFFFSFICFFFFNDTATTEIYTLSLHDALPIYNAAKRALDMWDAAFQNIQKYPDKIAVAYTAADAEKIVGSGKIAIFFGVEGGHAIQNDLGLLRVFYQLGVRYMTLTWMNTNDWADASGDTARWGGLNEFGEKVVREMNRLGMIVDISHVSDDTFWDVMRVSKKPVIASHSCCRALANHFRNMSDDMLRALAKNGGVIGINYYAGYLDDKYEPAVDKIMKSAQPELDALEAKYPDHNAQYDREKEKIYDKYRSKYPKVSINRLIEHIDHAVKVAGIDHVGLGSDFDGISAPPAGLEDVTKLPRITQMLLDRGYTDEQIKKILGGNFLRVYREVIGE